MPSYCLKCRENTKSIILQLLKAVNGGIIILPKCTVYSDNKSKFIKKQEAKRLLNIRTLLSKIPILKDILF